jgi:hypothetical protein
MTRPLPLSNPLGSCSDETIRHHEIGGKIPTTTKRFVGVVSLDYSAAFAIIDHSLLMCYGFTHPATL